MNSRSLRCAFAAIAAVLTVAGLAQTPSGTPAPETVTVVLTTNEGPITLALEKARAPVTTANFLRYVDGRKLDGTTLYRAVKVQPRYGLVQGGINNDPKRALPPIAHEPTSRTGLSHKDGTISMARNAPGTAQGDFFVTVGDIPSMDADPKQTGDNQGFAAFGHVTGGMDIVRHTLDAPTDPMKGSGVMKGQYLLAPVRILTARRE